MDVLRDVDRGQAIQIGAVIFFAFLVIALAGYQAVLVPQQNRGVEFSHNQEVQNDMLGVRSAVLGTAATGAASPATVQLGTQYPARIVAVNPPPASGSLRTASLGTQSSFTVNNTEALDDEVADYWSGVDNRSFATRKISYAPGYNEFDTAPTTVYEQSVVYNRGPEAGGGVAPKSEQTVVDGRTITLVAVQGRLDRTSSSSLSVDPAPDTAPFRSVAVRGDANRPVQVTLSTELSEAAWERLLSGELDGDTTVGSTDDGDDRYLAALSCVSPDPCGTLTLTFERGVVYDLRLAGVSVGDGSVSTAATYAVPVTGDGASIAEGGSQQLVVEVRDQFNNPVSGVSVAVTNNVVFGSVTAVAPTTDGNGRAVFRYEAPNDVNQARDVTVDLGFDGPDQDPNQGNRANETASLVVTVLNADGSSGGGGGGGGTAPTVDSFDVTDQTSGNTAEYDVSWSVSDADNDLDSVTVELIDANNNVKSSSTTGVAGGSASGMDTLSDMGGSGKEYEIRLTVTDAAGNSNTASVTDTADGTDP